MRGNKISHGRLILEEVEKVLRLLLKKTKSQSILEYALLVGIVAAALLLMQSFVKRGFQGNLKDSADRMGEQFSPSGTTSKSSRVLTGTEIITEETATTEAIAPLIPTGENSRQIFNSGVYSSSERTSAPGSFTTSENQTKTESARDERYQWTGPEGLPSEDVDNFTSDNPALTTSVTLD